MATLGKIVVLLGFVYPVTQGLPVEPQTSTLDGKDWKNATPAAV